MSATAEAGLYLSVVRRTVSGHQQQRVVGPVSAGVQSNQPVPGEVSNDYRHIPDHTKRHRLDMPPILRVAVVQRLFLDKETVLTPGRLSRQRLPRLGVEQRVVPPLVLQGLNGMSQAKQR